jgi:hypothetical protein
VLLQIRHIIERAKRGVESQFLKGFGLFGRAKVNGDFVVGPLGVLDEMCENSASDVTWSTIAGTINIGRLITKCRRR